MEARVQVLLPDADGVKSFGHTPIVELLDHMAFVQYSGKIPYFFFTQTLPFYIAIGDAQGSNFSTSWPNTVFCCFDNNHKQM